MRKTEEADIRQWISFEDEEEDRTWVFDVTFMTSSWHCIYGSGCKGILETANPKTDHGCCSHGAHFADGDDKRRVSKFAKQLTAADWQYKSEAKRLGGAIGKNDEGEVVTKTIDGACIFLNRSDFPGGPGCSLHSYALRNGINPIEAKPDVCWQLPLRREDAKDSMGRVTSTITQWDRRHWGDGGEDFAWWCTEGPEAFESDNVPVYIGLAEEIKALTSTSAYENLRKHLAEQERAPVLIKHLAIRRRSGKTGRKTR